MGTEDESQMKLKVLEQANQLPLVKSASTYITSVYQQAKVGIKKVATGVQILINIIQKF